jgi:hypothetical protein
MSAKRPLAGIKVLLLIIMFLWYFAPSFQIFCSATCDRNNTIESDHFPLNSQNNYTDKLKCKAKKHSFCSLKSPQFSAALTTRSDHPQGTFNEISTAYYHAANQHESFYVQEAEKLVTLDHSLYLSYQVFLS